MDERYARRDSRRGFMRRRASYLQALVDRGLGDESVEAAGRELVLYVRFVRLCERAGRVADPAGFRKWLRRKGLPQAQVRALSKAATRRARYAATRTYSWRR